jgi:hypothetical protein
MWSPSLYALRLVRRIEARGGRRTRTLHEEESRELPAVAVGVDALGLEPWLPSFATATGLLRSGASCTFEANC